MTHENLLNDVRDALINAQVTLEHLGHPPLIKVDEALTRLDAFLADVPDGLGEAVNWDTGRMSKFIEFKNKHGYEPHQVVHIGSALLHTATTKGNDDE